jgi:hypothetical protein
MGVQELQVLFLGLVPYMLAVEVEELIAVQ